MKYYVKPTQGLRTRFCHYCAGEYFLFVMFSMKNAVCFLCISQLIDPTETLSLLDGSS